MNRKKIHLFHPTSTLTPACRPHLAGKEFKAVERHAAAHITCKNCLFLIATGWVDQVLRRIQ